MLTAMNFIKRILTARPEVQGALLATISLLSLFDVIHLTMDQRDGVDLAIVAWMGLVAKTLFGKDIDELSE